MNFTGGTGEVIFDANGDRLGFAGAIYNYKPITNMPSDPNEVRAHLVVTIARPADDACSSARQPKTKLAFLSVVV